MTRETFRHSGSIRSRILIGRRGLAESAKERVRAVAAPRLAWIRNWMDERAEFDEWVESGVSRRFGRNPLARFFLDRAVLRMQHSVTARAPVTWTPFGPTSSGWARPHSNAVRRPDGPGDADPVEGRSSQ